MLSSREYQLFDIHVFTANTPLYILRKLREETLVVALANSETPEKLFADIVRSVSSYDREAGQLSRIYVNLTALYLSGRSDLLDRLNGIDASKVKWFKEILQYMRRNIVNVQVQVVDAAAAMRNWTEVTAPATPVAAPPNPSAAITNEYRR